MSFIQIFLRNMVLSIKLKLFAHQPPTGNFAGREAAFKGTLREPLCAPQELGCIAAREPPSLN